ncbi:MAG: hypothetical protein ABI361_00230 [Nitrososphaera sp.]|jgi:hypothetical protein
MTEQQKTSKAPINIGNSYTPNETRPSTFNPNSPASKASSNTRSNQMEQNNKPSKGRK